MGIDCARPRHIDADERRILGLLVAQAAITLQNAQLHEQVRRYAVELERRVAARTAELERQRQRLQTILDSAGEGIQIMGADGRIEYINPATEQLTGFIAQEVVGQVSRLWKSASGEPSGLEQARQQLRQGQAWRGEVVNQRRDGTRYDSGVTVTPLLDEQQQITGYVAVHRDITRLKELERLKAQFVERIGHELRVLLAIIKLHVELLKRGKLDKLADYVQIMLTQIERQQRLIDGFLKVSQFDAGLVLVTCSLSFATN